MKRSVQQFALICSVLAVLGGVAPVSALAAVTSPASVGGVVRDSAGTPQMGVVVELLRSDSTLVAKSFTDQKGFYSFAAVLPGQYALKAMSASFIPTLKQNLRVHASTVVNLTMNTLYDLMQWAPQPHRARLQGEDDWAWTLRSAESRPLLRWQEDGSPILVSDGAEETRRGAQRRRKLRVTAQAGERRFGAGPEQVSLAMQQDTSARRRLVMSAETAPDADAAGLLDAMLGFREQMRGTGLEDSSMQTLAAVVNDPYISGGVNGAGDQGLQAVSIRSWQTVNLLGALEAEAGSDQVLARLGDGAEIVRTMPFASLTLHRGQGQNASSLEYRLATARNAEPGAGQEMPGAWLPVLTERNGELVLEHGLHQELGWAKDAGPAEMRLVIFGDSIVNPVIEGSGRLVNSTSAGQSLLIDRASGLVRGAGPNYSTTGMLASVESRLPGGNHIRLSYASGDALVMHAATSGGKVDDVAAVLSSTHARRAQMYALALSGKVDGAGTQWRASYRWQPASTVTQVAPYAVDASEPYLNIYIRQPIWAEKEGAGSVEAQVDLRNLLAEGYQPFLITDGSHLYFAQAERAIRGGVAFNF